MIRRQPKALPFLFLTEMWERFGFYIVQGMLVLYVAEAWGFSDERSFTLSGTFMALAYVAPILGGFLADRLLGFKAAIYSGGIFLCLGYAILILPFRESFYLGLGTVIVGTGLFKPSISALLGSFYRPHDPTRDAGFTFFYMGINLGVFLAGLSSGYVKEAFGWHAIFVLAFLGMVLALGLFKASVRVFPKAGQNPLLKKKYLHRVSFLGASLFAAWMMSQVLKSEVFARNFLPLIGLSVLFFLLGLTLRQTPFYRRRLILLDVLILSSVIFWMLMMQLFLSATFFIERCVDRTIGSFTLPTPVFYSLESIFVIMLGPFLAFAWQSLSEQNKNPSPLLKFALAMLFVGLCFLLLSGSTFFPNAKELIHPAWVVLAYLLITIGELLLSPIGLATVTIESPPHLAGMMMGIWFVATGFGGSFAGFLARLSAIPLKTSPEMSLIIYRQTFFYYSLIAFSLATILVVIRLSLKERLPKGG